MLTAAREDPRWLRGWLGLLAVHSAAVGVGLVWHPRALLAPLGFATLGEPFFATQGGVFHGIMAIAYAWAARDPAGSWPLVQLAVVVKTVAAVFLVTYWALHAGPWSVLVSGVIDGMMALALAGLIRLASGHEARRA